MKKIFKEDFNKAVENWSKNNNDADLQTILNYCIQEGIMQTFTCVIPTSSNSKH